MTEKHTCDVMKRAQTVTLGAGASIHTIERGDAEHGDHWNTLTEGGDKWFAVCNDGEHGVVIFHCPFCGVRLP